MGNYLENIKASHKYSVGDTVVFTLGQHTPYQCEAEGKILQVIPYGFGAYYVIEYSISVDYALDMVYSTNVRGVE